MTDRPAVRSVVMFKHGVAYVTREGRVEAPFELAFTHDEMSDVLKSLVVRVVAGEATLGALGFDRPTDPLEDLQKRRLELPFDGTFTALLARLSGRRVSLEIDGEPLVCEVLGFEQENAGRNGEPRRLVVREEDGSIGTYSVAIVPAFKLLDDASRDDLAYFVERSRAAGRGDGRTVRIDVRGTAEMLHVSYVVPAPTWRVTYRLECDGETTGLTAWAIVHNPVDEDLDDVTLVLTTGQPVSFEIDLYNPQTVARARMSEQSRASAAPTRFERAAFAMAAPPAMQEAVGEDGKEGMAEMGAPRSKGRVPLGRPSTIWDEPEEAPAELTERGESFEYRVKMPVSLRRGGSAMVPLLDAQLGSRKERIWREGSVPTPEIVVSFDNATGAVLEEGAAVVYELGVYAGESMVPYSTRGSAVKIAFARDLALHCSCTVETEQVFAGLSLPGDAILEEYRYQRHFRMAVHSDHDEAVEVVFEVAVHADETFDLENAVPFERTPGFHRFRATAVPRTRTEFVAVASSLESHRVSYYSVNGAYIARWAEGRMLDARTLRQLERIVTLGQSRVDGNVKHDHAVGGIRDLREKQTAISAQLQVLKEKGPEGELRLRLVRELEGVLDAINQHERDIAEIHAASLRIRTEIDAVVKQLAGAAK